MSFVTSVGARENNSLERWGYDAQYASLLAQMNESRCAAIMCPGRIVWQGRGGYQVMSGEGACSAGMLGHPRVEDAPVTGDWVGLEPALRDGDRRIISAVLPRRTCLSRKGAGRTSARQIIAANVDVVVVVTSPEDLSQGRLVRYREAVRRSGAEVVFVLNKVDALACVESAQRSVAEVVEGAPVVLASALRGDGIDVLSSALVPGRTLAVVGSSGVGKSSLIAAMLGGDGPGVGLVRADGRGQHTTTTRQIWLAPRGGMLLDTPGMRELSVWAEGQETEDGLAALSHEHGGCRFRDCRHESEPGCALLTAVEAGTLTASVLVAHKKVAREDLHQRQRRKARSEARGRRRR